MSDIFAVDEIGMPPTSTADLSSTPVKKKGKKFENRRQTKAIIQNVYNFLFKLRSESNLKKIDFNKTQLVTSEACGVSLAMVQSVSKEYKNNFGQFCSSRKSIYSTKPMSFMDDFNQDIVRRTIFEFYDEGEFPTARSVHEQLKEKINYKGSVRSVNRLFHNLGFRFKKCYNGRNFLMEKGDIVVERLEFFRKMNGIREKTPNKPIFYLDKTWINQNYTRSHIRQNSNNDRGLKIPTGIGSRLILLHIGSAKTGFIPQCKLLYKITMRTSSDYYSEKNNDIFRDWFLKVINMLEEPSIIVMDKASYHSIELYKAPTTHSKKEIIQNWLTEKQIPFSPLATKVELLEKVKRNKKKERVYELDKEVNKAGHEVVCLPPYHCQYNPIELIWEQVKNEVAYKNITFKIADVEKLTHEAIENVTLDNWKKCVQHSERIQKKDADNELAREILLEPVILTINPEDSSFSDADDDEDSCD